MGDRFQPVVSAGGGGAAGITSLTQDVLAGPGSGAQAATVEGLQGNPVDAAAPATNNLLLWDGAQWTPSDAYYWRTTPDVHDLGVWRMGEAAGNFANTGSDGALDLVPTGTIVYRAGGPLGTSAYTDGTAGCYVASADTTKCQPANFTVWSWVLVRAQNAQFPIVIAKLHDPVGSPWVQPYFDYIIEIYDNTNPGKWGVGMNDGGTLNFVPCGGTATRFNLADGNPHLLAMTYDGANMTAFMDGAIVRTDPIAGALTYGGGPVVRAANPNSVLYGFDGWLGEARVRDEVLTEAQLAEIYRRHLGLWP